MNKRLITRLLLLSGSVAFLAATGLAGFLTAHVIGFYDKPYFNYFEDLGNSVADGWEELFIINERADLNISSIFTSLYGSVVYIPKPDRKGSGGAVTSWGQYIVVMTHEGKIYFVDQNLNHALSNIAAPFNGYEDYVEAATKPPFDEADYAFRRFRYNDIAQFVSHGRRGFLVSYTKYHKEKHCYTNTISRLYIGTSDEEIVSTPIVSNLWTDIYETNPCLPLKRQLNAIEGHMAGGRMVFDGDRTVYLASGDYHWDGLAGPRTAPGTNPETAPAVAQDPATDYGKVLAIDVETGKARQVSRGHRNMQGIALDRAGRVWVVEHGVRGGDELNLVIEGENYGWPLESYGTKYSGKPLRGVVSFGRKEQFRRPKVAWLPSIAVSGLMRIEGFHRAWDGDLLAATLKGKMLVRIHIADGQVIYSEYIDVGNAIRHVHQHSDGRIVLWMSDKRLIVLSPALGNLGWEYVRARLSTMEADEDVVRRVRKTIHACMECHSLDPAENTYAPSLANIFGAPIGSTKYRGYSEALLSDRRIWTREILAEYLSDPQSAIPGTTMAEPGISEKIVLEKTIDILEGLATDTK